MFPEFEAPPFSGASRALSCLVLPRSAGPSLSEP